MAKLASACRLFLLGALACGCGGADVPDEATVTELHFTTSSEFPDNPKPTNVDVTVTDSARSRAIYEATVGLPDFPPSTFNCPADLGYRHTIDFTLEGRAPVTATLNIGGCRDATISGAPPVRQTDEAYWQLLAQHLGVDEPTLFVTAPQ
jgi:hypothetical protein